MLPLSIGDGRQEPQKAEQHSEPVNNGPELFSRLKDIARRAVPEIETKDWAKGFQDKIEPQHIPFFLMRVQGYTLKEISQMTQVSVATVKRKLASPAGQELLRELYAEAGMVPGEITGAFQDAAMDAVEIVVDLAHHAEKEETRLKAAFSILDRAGYGAVKKQETKSTVTVTTVSSKDLEEMRNALQESMEMPAEFEILSSTPIPEDEDAGSAS